MLKVHGDGKGGVCNRLPQRLPQWVAFKKNFPTHWQ